LGEGDETQNKKRKESFSHLLVLSPAPEQTNKLPTLFVGLSIHPNGCCCIHRRRRGGLRHNVSAGGGCPKNKYLPKIGIH
jgi:hypothetical protein